MKREWKLQWGKEDRISNERLNCYICIEVAGYIKVHIISPPPPPPPPFPPPPVGGTFSDQNLRHFN